MPLFNGKVLSIKSISKMTKLNVYAVKKLMAAAPANADDFAPHITAELWRSIQAKKQSPLYQFMGEPKTVAQIAALTGKNRISLKNQLERAYSKAERDLAHNERKPIDVFHNVCWMTFPSAGEVGFTGIRKGQKAIYLVDGKPLDTDEAAKHLGKKATYIHELLHFDRVA